jgi:hypothetical protein
MNAKVKFLVTSLMALAFMWATAAAQTVVPVGPFSSVKADGGHNRITLRYGATQRVTLLSGDRQHTQITTDGDRLVINNCRLDCPRGYKVEIEIVTPVIKGISLSNGGLIQSRGEFPAQGEISVAVDNGGMIDIRAITVNNVTAAVHDGGKIFARPRNGLVVSIADGGAVTYWGNPQNITKAIKRGGVVEKGEAADADKPLSEIGSAAPPVPAVPRAANKPRGQFWE